MAKKSWSRVLEGTGGAGSVYRAGSIPGKHSQPEASAGKGMGQMEELHLSGTAAFGNAENSLEK